MNAALQALYFVVLIGAIVATTITSPGFDAVSVSRYRTSLVNTVTASMADVRLPLSQHQIVNAVTVHEHDLTGRCVVVLLTVKNILSFLAGLCISGER
jgi:hypothetical protein